MAVDIFLSDILVVL
ncbi:hypothetical protein YPPY54_1622, partial [Yersinia pestis PY-54]